MISKEILPRMNLESSLVKHTALRIAFCAKNEYAIPVPNIYRPDTLEFQIRHRSISHQEADLVSIPHVYASNQSLHSVTHSFIHSLTQCTI